MKKLVFASLLMLNIAYANEIRLETGPLSFSRNEIKITGKEGDSLNTKNFQQDNTIGYRLYYKHNLEKSFIRFLYAPLETSFTGKFDSSKNFNGTVFDAGDATIDYKFNSYRVTYGRELYNDEKWSLYYGVVGKIRDAYIQVSQNNKSSKSSNVGFVPLFHFSGNYYFSDQYQFLFDVEALGAPQGRAIDAGLFFNYKLNKTTDLSLGYRGVEGGADNDKVYNFSLINQYSLGINYSF